MNREVHVRFCEGLGAKLPRSTLRVVTCGARAEAQAALMFATKVLEKLGVVLNKEKTRIVHVKHGFEFLGYKIKRGSKPLRLSSQAIKSGAKQGALYAYPRQKSIDHFREQIKKQTKRRSPLSTQEIINGINPIIRGWGNYYCKAHVRGLFNQLDRWVRRRLWSQCYKRWRNCGWKAMSVSKLHGEMELASLIELIPSLKPALKRNFVKAGCGKSARPVWVADGGKPFNWRLLRPDTQSMGKPCTRGSDQQENARLGEGHLMNTQRGIYKMEELNWIITLVMNAFLKSRVWEIYKHGSFGGIITINLTILLGK